MTAVTVPTNATKDGRVLRRNENRSEHLGYTLFSDDISFDG